MENYLPLITGSGGALIVLALVAWAFYEGKLHSHSEFSKLETENDHLRAENNQLREAMASERKALNETASAGQVTNQLITALAGIAAERDAARKAAPRPGLAAEDPVL